LKKPLTLKHIKPRLLGHWGTTPFDMVVMNDLNRFHLVADVIDRVPQLGPRAAYAKQAIRDKLVEHKQYTSQSTARTCRTSSTGNGRDAPTVEVADPAQGCRALLPVQYRPVHPPSPFRLALLNTPCYIPD
jgi:hypothetical protein